MPDTQWKIPFLKLLIQKCLFKNINLKVVDVRSSDSGIYVCVATNEAGTDQQAFTLLVWDILKI